MFHGTPLLYSEPPQTRLIQKSRQNRQAGTTAVWPCFFGDSVYPAALQSTNKLPNTPIGLRLTGRKNTFFGFVIQRSSRN